MRSAILAFVLGIWWTSFLSNLPTIFCLIGFILFAILLISILYFNFNEPTKLLASLVWGFCWAIAYAHYQLAWTLPSGWQAKPIKISGYIANLPQQNLLRTNFIFQLENLSINNQVTKITQRVHLNWYQHYPSLVVGDHWQLLVKLKRNHGFADPGAFDYERWLFENGIRANGYVVNNSYNQLLKHSHYAELIQKIRFKITNKIKQALNNDPAQGVITALTTGTRDDISQEQWQILQQTGTIHLVIIAGLHMGFLVSLIFFIVRWGWKRSAILCLCIPAPIAAAAISILSALAYSALADFAVPTQRALIMITLFMLSIILRRRQATSYALMLALLIIVLINPLATLESSLWLSFGAVSIICYGLQGRWLINSHGQLWLRMQIILSVGMFPLCLFYFQQASFISIVANLIAVPTVGLLIMPLSLCGITALLFSSALSTAILKFAACLVGLLWRVLYIVNSIPGAVWHHALIHNWIFLTTALGVLILLMPAGLPGRWLSIFCLLPLLSNKAVAPSTGEIFFTLLDVGQGLAVVVQSAQHVLIYDTGPKFSADFDTGQAVLIPYLLQQGINNISLLMVSHGDNDHIGGAASLLKQLTVNRILTSVPQRFLPHHAELCQQGQEWRWDGVTFQVLYPPLGEDNLDNNSSCVLQISNESHRILLTGDIEKLAEDQLVKNPNLGTIDILVAPHHGSRTSSTENLITKIKPHYVLFPIGYLNRYHFPAPEVIARYQALGASLFDTATDGAISFEITARKAILRSDTYRKDNMRYWQQ